MMREDIPISSRTASTDVCSADAKQDRAVGALLGLAVGDALGTTLEFKGRDTYEPLDDIVGGGPFHLEPGQWTDDTAMALCLADSLIAHNDLRPDDLMSRFTNWWRYGYNSCTGTCFDIGNTVKDALSRFEQGGSAFAGLSDPSTAGNGSLMRQAPVSIRWHLEPDKLIEVAEEQSRTTHAAPACLDACVIFATLTADAINGRSGSDLLRPQSGAYTPEIKSIIEGSYRQKTRPEINGSGYVVDSLEAALWANFNADNFQDAVLLAANLGDDADTTAAIAGQLAGARWGKQGIPQRWLAKLAWMTDIEQRALTLYGHSLVSTDSG